MSEEYTPRTWGLTRASTLRQSESPATQREIIGRACQSLTLGEPIFLNEPLGTSGRTKRFAERSMGNYVMRTLRKGDTLVVTAIDRLCRNFIDQYTTIQILFDRGIRIIILKGWGGQAIDLKKATDRIMLAILAWVAEVEGERIAERVKEGLTHRRKNGLCVGHRAFTYIQCFSADGKEIPTGEFSKAKGHLKRNVYDTQWLDQLCELLVLQKATRAQGRVLVDYCQERKFVNRAGDEWWRGPIHCNAHGTYMNRISSALKRVRRYAVLGQLPDEYNYRVLAITGDTPVTVEAKKRPPRSAAAPVAVPSEADMMTWTAEDWQRWYAANHGSLAAAFE